MRTLVKRIEEYHHRSNRHLLALDGVGIAGGLVCAVGWVALCAYQIDAEYLDFSPATEIAWKLFWVVVAIDAVSKLVFVARLAAARLRNGKGP